MVIRILKLILAALFLLALPDMPYGYYELVRFVGMVGFAILAYKNHQEGSQAFMIVWGASALLINPFFKVAHGRCTMMRMKLAAGM